MLLSKIRRATFAAAGLLATAGTASAHHLMGGKIPSTFAEGILSGLGHPIIGPDHLAFLVALGIAVGVGGLSFATPFFFLVAMVCGVAAHVAAFNIPASEMIVALSVIVAGVLLALDRRVPASGWAAIFSIAGFFHGYAYGESIYGAETTPLAAYLVGMLKPRMRLNGPAINPFNMAICNGSASETLRVRLLSSPHATQAPTIASGPTMLSKVGAPDHDNTAAPATRLAMPIAIRRSKFSWKMNHAIKAVAAPSTVRRSEAVAALVRARPNISRSGPRTPPTPIAAASHGKSARERDVSGAPVATEGTMCRNSAA